MTSDNPRETTLPGRLPALPYDRTRSAAAQVADALREAILAMDLPPGCVLARAELAAHYRMSQTPIRDALMRLDEEGLVDIYPQHATVVSRIDAAAAQQAHFLRRSLELEIVRHLAAQPDGPRGALVVALQGWIRRQSAALEPQDRADFVAADRGFHRELYLAAHVGPLWDLVRRQSGHIDRLRSLHLPAAGKAEAVIADHRAITDAIARGDADDAARALREHLSGTLSFIDAVRAQHPDWFTA